MSPPAGSGGGDPDEGGGGAGAGVLSTFYELMIVHSLSRYYIDIVYLFVSKFILVSFITKFITMFLCYTTSG